MLEMLLAAIENEADRIFVEKLYEEHAKKMFLIAYNILGDHGDAEDAVHDTIRVIIECPERFRQAEREDYLKKLIVVVCRNTALKRYHQKKRDREWLRSTTAEDDGDERIADIPDPSLGIEQIVISEETCDLLRDLISEMDLKLRDVITLRMLGFGNDEIARLMNISVDLVRQRIHRARMSLLKKGGERLHGIYTK